MSAARRFYRALLVPAPARLRDRHAAELEEAFAAMTVVLALGGTYGVTSYLVTQRSREIGIRVAIGAQSRDVVRAMLRGTAAVALGGVAAGLVMSLWIAPLMGDLLFGVSPRDPLVLTFAAAMLCAAALVAMLVPARRAALADPMTSLRT